jgi:hypothetical protein
MPASTAADQKLWRYFPDHPIGSTDTVAVTRARCCPECPNGEMNRLAERQFHEPYRWIPVGFRCNTCGTIYVVKRTYV